MPGSPRAAGSVAFVLKGYPRLSETFIAQEILALERLGLEILIVSLRHPTDRAIHPIHGLISAALLYLPEYLYREPAEFGAAGGGLAEARVLRGAGCLACRLAPRSDTKSRPPVWPGVGAGGGIAG